MHIYLHALSLAPSELPDPSFKKGPDIFTGNNYVSSTSAFHGLNNFVLKVFFLLIQVFWYYDYSRSLFTHFCFKTFLHSISGEDSPALLMFALLFLQFHWKYLIWLSYDKISFFSWLKLLWQHQDAWYLYFIYGFSFLLLCFLRIIDDSDDNSIPLLPGKANYLSDILTGAIPQFIYFFAIFLLDSTLCFSCFLF